MSFSDPRWLWLLVALPFLFLLEWRASRRAEGALEHLVGPRPGHGLLAQRVPGRRRDGILLRAVAFALLAVGAAGPEWGHELVRRSATGSDVALVLDVSASMDARDVPPSRLEEARREALAVLERLQGSRIGVVAFAGDAVRLCPLTLDRSAARLVLESLSSSSVSEPGSDLGRGLRMAARLMPGGRRSEQAILAWTDGEDLEGGSADAIEELARAGLRVFAVGVGTPSGDVVPVLDDQGRAVDIKRDESGGPVRSRLDEPLLRGLARRTRGGYFGASRPGGELPRLLAALGSLARSGRGERLVERPVPRFPLFAGAAALLLALERTRRRRRSAAMEESATALASRAAAALLLSMLGALLALVPRSAGAQTDWARGDAAYRRGDWAAAESLYLRRLHQGRPPAAEINLASARARLGKADQAESALARLSGAEGAPGQVAGYNLGTLHAGRADFDAALEELKRALERDPGDDDARYNYEWVLRHRRQPPRSPNQPPRPQPQPSQRAPQAQNPSAGASAPQNPSGPAAQTPAPRGGRGMNRQQAEQLLGSLEQLERLEQQRLHRVRVMRERRGKDW